MPQKIFYSWQSDSPNKTNRAFIEDALNRAIAQISGDLDLDPADRDNALELDKDTKGVSGSPNIAHVIFEKIDNSATFVADLSIVAKSESGRLIPNPNVLLEYGYALSELSDRRVISVINRAYYNPTTEDLPFDLRFRRYPIAYNLAENASPEQKRAEQDNLAKVLAVAIRDCLPVHQSDQPHDDSWILQPKYKSSSFLDDGEELCMLMDDPFGRDDPWPVFWHNGPQAFLRIIPLHPLDHLTSTKIVESFRAQNMPGYLGRSSGLHFRRNQFGGVVLEAKNVERQNFANRITQVTKTGEIWTIDGFRLDGDAPVWFIEPDFVSALKASIKYCTDVLAMEFPMRVIAGLSGIKGKRIAAPPAPEGKYYPQSIIGEVCVDDEVVWEGLASSANDNPREVLRPFFEMVFDAFGMERPDHLNNLNY